MTTLRPVLLVFVLAVLGPLLAHAQPTGKVPRVAVLFTGNSGENPAVQREPFERGLRELGWTPGSTISIEYRFGEGSTARLEEATARLLSQGVDVLVARADPAIRIAQRATRTVPIVMSSGSDPIANGFVKSLARPGGNTTGIANLVSELDGKRLELLREGIPSLARVAVLANSAMWGDERSRRLMDSLRANAREMRIELHTFEVARREDLADVFVAIDRARVGAVLIAADTLVLEPNRADVVALAARYRLPVMYPWHFYTEIGGLMSYATSIPAFHHRSASYVDRILKGAKPGDLPIEQPTKFEMMVNRRTARALGLEMPKPFLLRADQLID